MSGQMAILIVRMSRQVVDDRISRAEAVPSMKSFRLRISKVQVQVSYFRLLRTAFSTSSL